ncbi:putative serine protease K12H4.7 [Uranotaenia lowii]|uniref:putative serine protease K12H4.7 n=1 Tax=Uranotaenia lowii TaxID=190385 RepID=UPI00247ACFD1|nr:putative serine protease K12H4.7 [Uranotaenia lowii]
MRLPSLVLLVILGLLTNQSRAFNGAWEKLHREPPVRGIPSRDVPSVDVKWISQKVDNFDPQNPSTWSMRYMEIDDYYSPGGPFFIFLGGEWEISGVSIQRGHFHDMARELGARIFYTEHRYYGKSRPTPNTATHLLKYLNIDQALADLAHFIVEMRATIPGAENAKVFIAGGSYSATMVAWFRQKYPHLVNGGWASSAPLLAKMDFVEYKEVVSESIRLVGGESCANRIAGAYQQVEALLDAEEYDTVIEKFRLCNNTDFSNRLDKMAFLSTMSDYFAGIVQYHQEGDIEGVICEYLNNDRHASDIDALAAWITQWSNRCMDISYDSSVQYYSNTDWNHPANAGIMRLWLYQTCAEYGWYQTSGSEDQIFGSGFPVDLFVELCYDLYGRMFTESRMESNIDRTNAIYGDMNPAVTNVFFTQGQLDPWRPMGLQEDLNEDSPTVVIPLASHCADFGSISEYDSPEMRATKERVFELAKQWLS